MTACLFVGPSLREEDLADVQDVRVLPPAAQGDVWRTAQSRPRAIALVDGYFDGVPAVWHKEILWAMAEGIHVFGAASMGALRAAELAPFGMVGVGAIFEAYRDGTLEDDDEVAVLHGPAETGFRALSEPMVNVRATLERAFGARVVGAPLRDRLLTLAKDIFYRERTWPEVLSRAAEAGLGGRELERLSAWLPDGRLDQKRADALALIDVVRAFLAAGPGPKEVDFHFEWTAMWDDAVRSFGSASEVAAVPAGSEDAGLLDELKLQPGAWQQARQAALVRSWTIREAERRRLQPTAAEVDRALRDLRERHGLFTREALERWLETNDLDVPMLERLVTDEARRALVDEQAEAQVEGAVIDLLRLDGRSGELGRRARAKLDHLRTIGALDADPQLVGMAPLALRRWFFEDRLGCAVPEDVGAFARAAGYPSLSDFDRALVREYLYSREVTGAE